jgi:hypothetical protein
MLAESGQIQSRTFGVTGKARGKERDSIWILQWLKTQIVTLTDSRNRETCSPDQVLFSSATTTNKNPHVSQPDRVDL